MPANCCRKNNPDFSELNWRLATSADIDALLIIENQSFPSPWPRQHFLSELEKPYSTVLLACSPIDTPQEILGFIIFWQIIDEMHILNLAVDPAHRRRGLGRRLILKAIALAQEHDLKTVWLEVRPSNQAALSLYHALGFQHVATRKRYYDDTGEDALILCLSL